MLERNVKTFNSEFVFAIALFTICFLILNDPSGVCNEYLLNVLLTLISTCCFNDLSFFNPLNFDTVVGVF